MSSSSPWTPPTGRHKVNIGTSLGRALKARKGNLPTQKRSNLPERDFYALRYNFKPSSIDPAKSGSMEVKRKDNKPSSIIVEHPAQPNGVHVYKGKEAPEKEWACVLIFDEETGTYTLEKVESFLALEHIEKRNDSTLQLAPSPSPQPTSNRDIIKEDPEDDFLAEILPDDLQAVLSSSPPRPAPPSRPAKLPAKPRPIAVDPPAPPPPKPQPTKSKKLAKRATPEFSDREEEILQLKNSKPANSKRPRPSSPPPQPAPVVKPAVPKKSVVKQRPPPRKPSPPPQRPTATLELPGSASGVISPIPPLPTHTSTPASRQPPPPPLQPPVIAATIPSDSEEDDEQWDEVPAVTESEPQPEPEGVSRNLTMIEVEEPGEEIDMDEFENLMNEQLGDGEDGGGAEGEDDRFNIFPDSPESQHDELPMPVPVPGGLPMSLNAFAGGGGDEEDEYSSSDDDSDED